MELNQVSKVMDLIFTKALRSLEEARMLEGQLVQIGPTEDGVAEGH